MKSMKSWFTYLISGKKISTWANNTEEAERNLRKEFGDVQMELVGINYKDPGMMNALVGLRR